MNKFLLYFLVCFVIFEYKLILIILELILFIGVNVFGSEIFLVCWDVFLLVGRWGIFINIKYRFVCMFLRM